MTYLCLAVIFLHIFFVPIVVGGGAVVDSDKKTIDLRVQAFFIPVFKKSFDYDVTMKKAGEKLEKSDDGKDDSGGKNIPMRFFMRFALCVLRRISIRRIDIEGVIGTSDAAVSAVTAGFIKTVYADIRALFYCDGTENVKPDYDEEYIFIRFDGIISLRLWDIIYAAIRAACKKRGTAKNFDGAKIYGNAVAE